MWYKFTVILLSLRTISSSTVSIFRGLGFLASARLIPEQGAFPGTNPSIYAFTKVATHRNIYRVPVP